jgi:sterol desaturase/sphingolipid hydroxylase (fatty acid hydroxylase superfamily)
LTIILLYSLLRPFEKFKPIDKRRPSQEVRIDILYTILNKTGFLTLIFFFILEPLLSGLGGMLHARDINLNVDNLFPSLKEHAAASFMLYLLIFDFLDYIRHRLQHNFRWWWGLHTIHHSQRFMTLWTDSRNHLLDSLLKSLWFGTIGLLLGVPSEEFVLIIIILQAIEALSHTNTRLHFGKLGRYLLVSPHFHRLHHAMHIGHSGKNNGCNFATLFPLWDVLFGTARFEMAYPETGIADQLSGRNYGESFFGQQVQGIRLMFSGLLPAFLRIRISKP